MIQDAFHYLHSVSHINIIDYIIFTFMQSADFPRSWKRRSFCETTAWSFALAWPSGEKRADRPGPCWRFGGAGLGHSGRRFGIPDFFGGEPSNPFKPRFFLG